MRVIDAGGAATSWLLGATVAVCSMVGEAHATPTQAAGEPRATLAPDRERPPGYTQAAPPLRPRQWEWWRAYLRGGHGNAHAVVVGLQLHGGLYDVWQPEGLDRSGSEPSDDIDFDYGTSRGAGLRFDVERPFWHLLTFQVRPGLFMGRGSALYGDETPSGYLWIADLDVALGVRLGPFFMTFGSTLGLSRALHVERLKDRVQLSASFFTFDGGLVLARERDVRAGLRVATFPSYAMTFFVEMAVFRKARKGREP